MVCISNATLWRSGSIPSYVGAIWTSVPGFKSASTHLEFSVLVTPNVLFLYEILLGLWTLSLVLFIRTFFPSASREHGGKAAFWGKKNPFTASEDVLESPRPPCVDPVQRRRFSRSTWPFSKSLLA